MDCHRLKGGFAALPGIHPSVLGGLGRPSHTRLCVRMQLDAKRRATMFKRSVSGRVGARTSGADGWLRANRMRPPHSDSGAKKEAVQHFSRAGKTVRLIACDLCMRTFLDERRKAIITRTGRR